MPPVLRLYEDVLANDAELSLPAGPRLIFVLHGSVTKADRLLHAGEAIGSEIAARVKAGREGATVWRWELIADGADGAAAGAGCCFTRKACRAARYVAERSVASAR